MRSGEGHREFIILFLQLLSCLRGFFFFFSRRTLNLRQHHPCRWFKQILISLLWKDRYRRISNSLNYMAKMFDPSLHGSRYVNQDVPGSWQRVLLPSPSCLLSVLVGVSLPITDISSSTSKPGMMGLGTRAFFKKNPCTYDVFSSFTCLFARLLPFLILLSSSAERAPFVYWTAVVTRFQLTPSQEQNQPILEILPQMNHPILAIPTRSSGRGLPSQG